MNWIVPGRAMAHHHPEIDRRQASVPKRRPVPNQHHHLIDHRPPVAPVLVQLLHPIHRYEECQRFRHHL